jgi:hypothetical protein
MAILGLLLIAAAAVAGVELAVSNLGGVSFEVFDYGFTTTLAGLFGLGALTMAVAALGLWMITASFRRRRRAKYEAKHRETGQRLTEVDRTNAELVEENDRLRAELTEERRAAATLGGVAVPPGVGDVAFGDQVTDAARSNAITDTGRFDPYPTVHTGTGDGRTQTIDNTHFDDTRTGAEKASVVGRFRGDGTTSK